MINTKIFKIIFLINIVFFLGCAAYKVGRPKKKPKLSKAMEVSSKKHQGERVVKHNVKRRSKDYYYYPELEQREDHYLNVLSDNKYSRSKNNKSNYKKKVKSEIINKWNLGLVPTVTLLNNSQFKSISGLGIAIGWPNSIKKYTDFELSFETAKVSLENNLINSINKNVSLFRIGYFKRRYLTPEDNIFRGYLNYGLAYNHYKWKYNNIFQVEIYDDYNNLVEVKNITNDNLSSLEISAGGGVSLLQGNKFNLDLDINPTYLFFFGETGEGFSNDVFKNMFYLRCRLYFNIFFNPKN